MIKSVIQAIINLFGCKNKTKSLDSNSLCCKQNNISSKKPKKTTRKKNYSKNNK